MKYLLLALCFAIALAAPENHWAVLVAGSDGYGNYRHQADVLHAFQIMKRNGIPESNIVVMAYDDIAGNRRNPFPGQVFNKPGSPGVDVYAGATIDYKGRDVSPSNFLNVLSGNAAGVQGGNGKVLHSGPNDHIFIFFSDHGSGGLICFPHKNLYADDLNDTLQSMFEDKKFGKMVIYIETCYSGSMFEGILPPNTNIYATTAANAHESSWGHYCYPDDEINGKHVGSCLGDEYSISWMEDTDASDINTKTLQEQYYSVRDRVQGSHVMQYGDSRYTDSPLVNFQGTGGVRKGLRDRIQMLSDMERGFGVDQLDATLHYKYTNYLRTHSSYDQIALEAEIEHRILVDARFDRLFSNANLAQANFSLGSDFNFDCLRGLVDDYTERCGEFNDYAVKYGSYLVATCNLEGQNSDNFRNLIEEC